MKKFQFTLEKLWEYKKMQMDKEKLILAGLNSKKMELDKKINENLRLADRLDNEFREALRLGITALEIRRFRFQIEQLHRQLESFQKEKSSLKNLISRQMTAVIGLSREVSQMESLHDRQREEHKALIAKAEELRIEEFVLARSFRKKVI